MAPKRNKPQDNMLARETTLKILPKAENENQIRMIKIIREKYNLNELVQLLFIKIKAHPNSKVQN